MATVNNVVVRGHLTAESLFVAICGQFKKQPKGCKRLLDDSMVGKKLRYKNPLGPTMNKTVFYVILVCLIGGLGAYAFKRNQDIRKISPRACNFYCPAVYANQCKPDQKFRPM